jgi:putative ABC transport system substrate-binding protein
VVLVDGTVAQYRAAGDAALAQLSGAIALDPQDASAEGALTAASVVVAVGQKSFAFARSKAPATPTVFCLVLGVSKSMLSSTVTGVPMEPDPTSILTAIKAVAPAVRRVGLIYNPATSELFLPAAQRGAGELGLILVAHPVSGPAEVKEAARAMPGAIDALWLPPDPKLFSKEVFIFLLGFSAERSVPLIGFIDSFTQAGALASVSADYPEMGTRAGRLASEIALRPPDKRTPVPGLSFSPGKLTINLKTAAALKVTVSPTALSMAKQVFE